MPAVEPLSAPIRQSTGLSITSTFQDAINELCLLDADHQAVPPNIVVYDNAIKFVWPDNSRVSFLVGTMSMTEDGVRLLVPPYEEVPSGENPNNPPESVTPSERKN